MGLVNQLLQLYEECRAANRNVYLSFVTSSTVRGKREKTTPATWTQKKKPSKKHHSSCAIK